MKHPIPASLLVMMTLALPVSQAYAEPSTEATKKLAGQVVKKVALPLTAVLAAVDAEEAYADHCSHRQGADAAVCTTGHFVSGQIEDLGDIADTSRVIIQYQVIPATEQFWDDNGDDIKEAASAAADAAARGLITVVDLFSD